MPAPVITLPGYLGSPPHHWQCLWEAADPRIVRFSPASFDAPDLADWRAALGRAIAAAPAPPVLVAHSLACLLVPHLIDTAAPVAAAMLVAPPDPAGAAFPPDLAAFRAVPTGRLPFRTLVVASTDDPYGTADFAQRMAAGWGAGFVSVGAKGHINAESGLGDWPHGRNLLTAFCAGAGIAA